LPIGRKKPVPLLIALSVARIESIRNEIPGLRLLEIGIDFSKIDYACDVVLYSEFDSVKALEGSASHPAHLRVREEISDLCIARHQVDYSIQP
jgi:hypothetical protein